MTASLLEYALTRLARLHSGDEVRAAEASAELAAWRGASPAHEQAFREAQVRWHAVGGAASGLRGVVPKPVKAAGRARRLAKRAALLGLALLALAGVRWHLAQPIFESRYATDAMQTTRTRLPDGSQLEIAARTRLQVVLYRDRRSVRLEHGEARFEVAHDAQRPFVVQTRAGEVQVIGTVFAVSDRAGRVIVSVERGRVGFAGTMLGAGEKLRATDEGTKVRQRVDTVSVAPWRSGWLVFDDVPLSEALAEINAWRDEPVALADERAGQERLTGSFPIDDPQAVLRLLPRVLPVEVRHGASGPQIVSRP